MSLPSHPPRTGAFLRSAARLCARVCLALAGFAPALAPAQVKLMTNGDSITFGIGASDTNTRSYTAELARLLGSGYAVQKDGTGGATLLRRGQPSFWNTQGIRITSEKDPAVIYLMLGTNDSKPGNWTFRDEFVDDYLALIDLYRALPARPQIYLGLPPPATASPSDVNGPTVANEVIPRILEVARLRDVRVVDVHSPFRGPFRSLLPDGIHPNDEGHRVIARTLHDALVGGRYWRALPAEWRRVDVGATGYPGADALDETNTFQILGGGAALAGPTDAFRFAHRPVRGDLELTARVLAQENVDPLVATRPDSVAGVMVRDGEGPGARHVSVVATPGQGVSLRWRDAVGLSAGSTTASGVAAPVWLRVRRTGDTFEGLYSKDGVNWTRLGAPRSLALPATTFAGLVANSALGNSLTHARLDQVRIVADGITAPAPVPSPVPPAPAPIPAPVPGIAPVTSVFDPGASASRILELDRYAALFDPALGDAARFATGEAAVRPFRAAFPGTARDALGFSGGQMLLGPQTRRLFEPGVSEDLGLVVLAHVPALGGSGKALLLSINHSDTEPAIALGYDYGRGRFLAVFPHAFNGAPSELAGAGSARGAAHLVRLQKNGARLRLSVGGTLVAETADSRAAILASGQGGSLGLGGIRPLNPQFVGHVGKFFLRNGPLPDADALTLEADLRAWGALSAPAPAPAPTPAPTPPPEPAPGGTGLGGGFDPAASAARSLIGDAYAALLDPSRSAWRFATDEAAVWPARAVFPGTTRDAMSFDGRRMLPGPRAQDLFAPGVAQDLGLVALVHIPSSGGVGKAILFTVNRSDVEPAVALGYDYSLGRFFVVFPHAFNGAPSELAGAGSPRGRSFVVRLEKAAGLVRLRVDGVLAAETSAARPAVLAPGQGGPLGLGGIRPLNPQFVGHLGKLHFRAGALSEAEAAILESDLRAWRGF